MARGFQKCHKAGAEPEQRTHMCTAPTDVFNNLISVQVWSRGLMNDAWIRRSLDCIYWDIYFGCRYKIATTWMFSKTHLREGFPVGPNALNAGSVSQDQSSGFPSPFLSDSFRSLLQAAVTRVFILQTSSRLLKVILPNLERSSAACHKKGLALCQLHLLITAERDRASMIRVPVNT